MSQLLHDDDDPEPLNNSSELQPRADRPARIEVRAAWLQVDSFRVVPPHYTPPPPPPESGPPAPGKPGGDVLGLLLAIGAVLLVLNRLGSDDTASGPHGPVFRLAVICVAIIGVIALLKIASKPR